MATSAAKVTYDDNDSKESRPSNENQRIRLVVDDESPAKKSVSGSPTARASRPGDYTETSKPGQTRRGGAVRSAEVDYRNKTTDENFQAGYDDRTIAGEYRIRNAKVEGKRAANDNYQAANDNSTYDASGAENTENNYDEPTEVVEPSRKQMVERPKLRKAKVKAASPQSLVARATNRAAVYPWAFPLYFFVQTFFAFASLFFYIVAGAIYATFDIIEQRDSDGFLTGAVKFVIRGAAKVAGSAFDALSGAINKVFNIDISDFLTTLDPTGLFFFFSFFVFVIGLVTLGTIAFIYLLTPGVNPFGGKGSGAKFGTFMFAFIGYAATLIIPLAGLFPWFFVWTFTVARYPK